MQWIIGNVTGVLKNKVIGNVEWRLYVAGVIHKGESLIKFMCLSFGF